MTRHRIAARALAHARGVFLARTTTHLAMAATPDRLLVAALSDLSTWTDNPIAASRPPALAIQDDYPPIGDGTKITALTRLGTPLRVQAVTADPTTRAWTTKGRLLSLGNIAGNWVGTQPIVTASSILAQILGRVRRLLPENPYRERLLATTNHGTYDLAHSGDGRTFDSDPAYLWCAEPSNTKIRIVRAHADLSAVNTSRRIADVANYTNPTAAVVYQGGFLRVIGQDSDRRLRLYSRDSADVNTTTNAQLAFPPGAASAADIDDLVLCSRTGGLLTVATVGTAPANRRPPVYYAWWTASTDSWTAWEQLSGGAGEADWQPGDTLRAVQVDRHIQARNGLIAYTRRRGRADETFIETVADNQPPNAPTWDAPATGGSHDRGQPLTLDWTFSDPDTGDTQSAVEVRRRVVRDGNSVTTYRAGTAWQSGSDAASKWATALTALTLPANWAAAADDDHYYSLRTWDQNDAGPSAWSAETHVNPAVPTRPVITAPTAGGTTADPTPTITWTAADQIAYRIMLTLHADGSAVYDSGWVADQDRRSHRIPTPLTNQATYLLTVSVRNADQLDGAASHTFSVDFTPPDPPTEVTAIADNTAGRIRVTVRGPGRADNRQPATILVRRRERTNPTAVAEVGTATPTDPTADWTVHVDDWTARHGIAYEYQATVRSTIGAEAESAWTG